MNKNMSLKVLACLCVVFLVEGVWAVLPDKASLIEVEKEYIKNEKCKVIEFIHASGGKYLAIEKVTEPLGIVEIKLPESGIKYSIWVRVSNVKLGLLGEKSPQFLKEVNIAGSGWKWCSLGTYSKEEDGQNLELKVIPHEGSGNHSGIDCVLLTSDQNYIPTGVYNGYNPTSDIVSAKSASNKESRRSYVVEIDLNKTDGVISKDLTTALCQRAKRHVSENDSEWDDAMEQLFQGKIAVLFIAPYKKADKNGNWWDFKHIDEFVCRAKKVWKVKQILMLPQWKCNIPGKKLEDYTDEDLDKSAERYFQLVRHYSKEGPLFIKYWVVCDEWPGSGYWFKNYKRFVSYYSKLVKQTKEINPNLHLGGPVDCWPNPDVILELVEKCPELDFIAWNIFLTGRSDFPLESLFRRAFRVGNHVLESRRIGVQIRGKELPVIVTSYGPNHHAWEPLDVKLATPVAGVLDALILSRFASTKCTMASAYAVAASDCGILGRDDIGAKAAGMIDRSHKQVLNVRPVAYVKKFFQNYVDGRKNCPVNFDCEANGLNILTAVSANNAASLVLTNFADKPCNVKIILKNFKKAVNEGFQLPSDFVYCTENNISQGKGFYFNINGEAEFFIPPFSCWCINVPLL